MLQVDIDRVGLRRCYGMARLSPDKSNQNAAVIYLDRVIDEDELGRGINKFPPGLEVTPEMVTDREKKYFYIEHAERAAIYEAAKDGHKQRMEQTPDRWKKNVEDSLAMLEQCGVEIELLDVHSVGSHPITVNGEQWSP